MQTPPVPIYCSTVYFGVAPWHVLRQLQGRYGLDHLPPWPQAWPSGVLGGFMVPEVMSIEVLRGTWVPWRGVCEEGRWVGRWGLPSGPDSPHRDPAVPGGLSPSQGKRHRDFCLASCVTKPITAHRIWATGLPPITNKRRRHLCTANHRRADVLLHQWAFTAPQSRRWGGPKGRVAGCYRIETQGWV